jgi:DNA-binding NarL/FixJ family response regulator
MTSGIGSINLKVVIFDSDYYALHAINSYLAWDRRTRVTFMTNKLERLWQYLDEVSVAEQPDVIILDADHFGGPGPASQTMRRMLKAVPDVMLMCMVQSIDPALMDVAAQVGARAFLLKDEVRMQLAWAIVYAREHDLTVTASIARNSKASREKRLYNASILPEQRDYPEMTNRVRQAIRLCVIEGMPANLAADEMGISLHTIRGYIKEGYRILEAYDEHTYPDNMTPQELAFMRFTALADD